MHMNRYKRTHKELEIITLDCYTIQRKRSVKSKNLDGLKAHTQVETMRTVKMQRKEYRVERIVSME